MIDQKESPARVEDKRGGASERPAKAGAGLASILCVDDEPNVLRGLRLHLERSYRLSTAGSAAEGLAILEREGPHTIVISDMRMPRMNGASFLGEVRRRYPDTVRMLLTGYAEIDAAIAAVNEGEVFRFLTKPCPSAQLLGAVRAAAEQHRLQTAERVLLEKTLYGSVKAMTDVLSLTQPLAFGRAMRLRRAAAELAERAGIRESWQLEVAAMFSQLGCVTLAASTVEKLYYGRDLSVDEQKQARQLPLVAERLISPIPRLETVAAILARLGNGTPSSPQSGVDRELVRQGEQILRIVADYDALETSGVGAAAAIGAMRSNGPSYDDTLFGLFAALKGCASRPEKTREVPLLSLELGMVLAEDIILQNGVMLAPRGYEVTPQFAERIQNWEAVAANKRVRVLVR